MNHEEWLEEFYGILERGSDKYVRPADYRYRMARLLNKQVKPVGHQKEGLNKGWKNND